MEPNPPSGGEAAFEEPESTPARSPGPLWHPLVRSALFLLGYVCIQLSVALAGGAAVFLLGDRLLRPGGFVSSHEILLLGVALCLLPTVGMTWLFARYLDRGTLAGLGVRWPRGGRRAALRQLATMPAAAVGLLAGWLALILLLPRPLAAFRSMGISPGFLSGPPWWPLAPGLLLALLLAGFLLQGGLEEWVMRGYVFHTLKERWRPGTAALASSILFALLHAANPGVSGAALLNIVLAGLILAAVVERSGSLWGAALAHGVWNFAVACLLSVPVSGVGFFHLLEVSLTGDERWTGGAFGPEGSLALTLLGLPLAAALWRRPARDRPRRESAASTAEDGGRHAPSGESMV